MTDGGLSPADRLVHHRQRGFFEGHWNPRREWVPSDEVIRAALARRRMRSPVLDLGAGTGYLAASAPRRLVWSCDISSSGLQAVKGRAIVGAAERLPFASESFQTITALDVLEHVADPPTVLAECLRVAAPGGGMIATVPTMPLAAPEHRFHEQRLGEPPTLENLSRWDPAHERRPAMSETRALFEQAGWVVTEQRRIFGPVATWGLYHLEPRANRRLARWHRRLPATVTRCLAVLDRFSRQGSVCFLMARKPDG
jgi:ubiquinone/menaquinone biosynthesis C-methylase UbiE